MKHHVRDALFLHWPVDEQMLVPLLPEELELDLYDGKAWIGIVVFKAEANRLRFLPPVLGTDSFLQINVRTYVKYGGRSGVYFFSLNANRKQVVKVAGMGSFLPYRLADIKAGTKGRQHVFESKIKHTMSSFEELKLSYQIKGAVAHEPFGRWLTERYSLWTKPGNKLLRADIYHTPWKLYHVEGEISKNSMAPFLGKNLHDSEPVAYYSPFKKFYLYRPKVEM